MILKMSRLKKKKMYKHARVNTDGARPLPSLRVMPPHKRPSGEPVADNGSLAALSVTKILTINNIGRIL
jgi:hypothetical protein